MTTRLSLSLSLAGALFLAPGAVPPALAGDAAAAVRALYVPKVWNPLEDADFAGMTGLALSVFKGNAEAMAKAEDGACIDFVPTVDGQDYDEAEIAKTLKVEAQGAEEGDGTLVNATFQSFGEPRDMVWTMREVGGVWKVADIESRMGEWRLGDLRCP